MYASTSLNVRTGPSTEYSKAGSLSVKEAVTVTGVADTGWYRLDYNGAEAYVSNKYQQDTQVAVTVTSISTTSTASTASTNNVGNWVYGGTDAFIDGEWMAIYYNDTTGEIKYIGTGNHDPYDFGSHGNSSNSSGSSSATFSEEYKSGPYYQALQNVTLTGNSRIDCPVVCNHCSRQH